MVDTSIETTPGSRATTKRRERRKTLFDKKQKIEGDTETVEESSETKEVSNGQQDAAAAYLKSYHKSNKSENSKKSWKFNKHLQVWLEKHALDATMVRRPALIPLSCQIYCSLSSRCHQSLLNII